MKKKVVYVDMDGVLCDYIGRCNELGISPDEAKHQPGFFIGLKPIEGAIEAYRKLHAQYDVYILSAASWSNPAACAEKIEWVNQYLPEAYKRVIFSHNKHLCQGDYLIDDRAKCGADRFEGQWIQFGSEQFPDWDSVLTFIEVYSEFDEPDTLCRKMISPTMVEKTIATLDEYMKTLNAAYNKESSEELYKKITNLATLTNRWLKASGIEDESSYYDI